MKQLFIYIIIIFIFFSCQERRGSIMLRDVHIPIEFLSIKTPFLFQIDNKHAFKLSCEPAKENEFWRQAYYHGDEDTTICVSIENRKMELNSFLNSSKSEEQFISCLEYRNGILRSGTHLFTRDYIITSSYLMVSTVSKFDSSSLVTNKSYYRKSISITSANHDISVIFNIRLNDQIPFEHIVKHFDDYKVLYFP